jgi:hypothetical protein
LKGKSIICQIAAEKRMSGLSLVVIVTEINVKVQGQACSKAFPLLMQDEDFFAQPWTDEDQILHRKYLVNFGRFTSVSSLTLGNTNLDAYTFTEAFKGAILIGACLAF